MHLVAPNILAARPSDHQPPGPLRSGFSNERSGTTCRSSLKSGCPTPRKPSRSVASNTFVSINGAVDTNPAEPLPSNFEVVHRRIRSRLFHQGVEVEWLFSNSITPLDQNPQTAPNVRKPTHRFKKEPGRKLNRTTKFAKAPLNFPAQPQHNNCRE